MYQRLAEDLGWPVEVIGCPTIRENDGLAISSRNAQLTVADRDLAPVLYEALQAARQAAIAGELGLAGVSSVFAETIGSKGDIRYFTPVGSATMTPLDRLSGSVRLLASLQLGGVRLVDNLGFDLPAER
jgi:pantoate--beta-alanine ligase